MKYFNSLLIIISLSFLQCGHNLEIEKQVYISSYDFTEYTNKGFLFTPEKYNGEYESIGLIEVEIYPGIEKIKDKAQLNSGDTWRSSASYKLYKYSQTITPYEVLDSLYNISYKMGADAVINLEILRSEIQHYEITIEGIRASGFAIKRK